MIFYTDRFIEKGSAGCARGPLIFIRPKYKDVDRGLLEHEKVHVRQFWAHVLLHGWRYRRSPSYRLACEVEAYKEQARWYADDRRPLFAKFISEDYGLDVTIDEAYVALCK